MWCVFEPSCLRTRTNIRKRGFSQSYIPYIPVCRCSEQVSYCFLFKVNKDDFFVVLKQKNEILRFDLLITADTLVAYVKVFSHRKLNLKIDKGIVLTNKYILIACLYWMKEQQVTIFKKHCPIELSLPLVHVYLHNQLNCRIS